MMAPSGGRVPYHRAGMSRRARYVAILMVGALAALVITACGTQHVAVPTADTTYASDMAGAQIFSQRCSGCHTLSYAAANGSGANPRTYLNISGPNFNVRCERPVTRVLYAIENGGFSGAYMPQNIVVGQQAREVAMFVAKYAGRQAVIQPGTTPCKDKPIGTLPALPAVSASS
jgi:mono/diheme cytochrome c family protein